MTVRKLQIAALSMILMSFLFTINAAANDERQRIKFARGENSTSISGSAVSGSRISYLVGGREGQKMSVKISSNEKNAVFQIKDAANGKFLSRAGESDAATEWNDTVSTTGDYEIVVGSTRGNTDYKLSVTVK